MSKRKSERVKVTVNAHGNKWKSKEKERETTERIKMKREANNKEGIKEGRWDKREKRI